MKTLNTYFNGKLIGHLIQDNDGDMNFTYLQAWIEDPQAIAISYSLPLQKETFGRKQCLAFFDGILPEENQRKIIAKNLGISDKNAFSMLEKIGGECAGALSFWPEAFPNGHTKNNYHELTDDALEKILQELPKKPLLAGEDRGVRLSLAGVQDKFPIYLQNEKIAIPLNGAPSTHILKPASDEYDDIIFNEYFCLKLAREIGLSTANAEIKKTNNFQYLLVERYDRQYSAQTSAIVRIHQEDFCQALAIPSTKKYQIEEGPSLKQCFNLLREWSSKPVLELDKLLGAVIFNFLIGNCDAHGKNFSLLYSNELVLSPLYDLISTVCYPDLDTNMAMKIGGEYSINRINFEIFKMFAKENNFSQAAIRKKILEIIDKILDILPKMAVTHAIQEEVALIIARRCKLMEESIYLSVQK